MSFKGVLLDKKNNSTVHENDKFEDHYLLIHDVNNMLHLKLHLSSALALPIALLSF